MASTTVVPQFPIVPIVNFCGTRYGVSGTCVWCLRHKCMLSVAHMYVGSSWKQAAGKNQSSAN